MVLVPDGHIAEQQPTTSFYIESKKEEGFLLPEFLDKLSPRLCRVVFDTKECVIKIVIKAESGKERRDLGNQVDPERQTKRERFIENLRLNCKDENILSILKTRPLQVFEIPGKDLFVISLDGKNVDYIYSLDGKEYFDFKWRRNDTFRHSAFIGFAGIEEVNIDGANFIVKDGKKINIFSQEGLLEYLNIADNINKATPWLKEVGEMDWDKILKEDKQNK